VLVISGFFTRRGISPEIIRNLGTSFQKCLSALSLGGGGGKVFKEYEFERASNYEPARGARMSRPGRVLYSVQWLSAVRFHCSPFRLNQVKMTYYPQTVYK
jgi:hypothetical protein